MAQCLCAYTQRGMVPELGPNPDEVMVRAVLAALGVDQVYEFKVLLHKTPVYPTKVALSTQPSKIIEIAQTPDDHGKKDIRRSMKIFADLEVYDAKDKRSQTVLWSMQRAYSEREIMWNCARKGAQEAGFRRI